MSHRCPHCLHDKISTVQKLASLWLRPATCERCGRHSYLPLRHAVAALFIWVGSTWGLIMAALFTANAIYLVGSTVAALFAVDFCVLRAPLLKLQ